MLPIFWFHFCSFGFIGGLVKSVAGSVVGGLFGKEGQESANAASAESAKEMMDFQERMYKNRYSYQMDDMKRAGLNPMLSFQQSPGAAPSGSRYEAKNEWADMSQNLAKSPLMAAEINNLESTSAKSAAEAQKALAEKAEIEARTPTHASHIALNDAQIRKINTELPKILEDTRLSSNQANKLVYEMENIIKTGALIDAQTLHQLAGADLTRAQIQEIVPRINKLIADTAYTRAGTEFQQFKSDMGNLVQVPAASEVLNSAGKFAGESAAKGVNLFDRFTNSAKRFFKPDSSRRSVYK